MILYLNCQKSDGPTWTKQIYLLEAAKRLGFDFVQKYDNQPNPELVLNIEPYNHFIKGSKWSGIWEIDLVLDRPQMSTSDWAVADDVFVANTAIPSRMNGFLHKTSLLFQAIDPIVHRRIPEIKQEYDFVFAGTNNLDIYKERARLIKLLREYEFSFKDYGKGLTPHKYIECLNSAKVQFIRSGNTLIANSWTAQRFFECLAIGPVLVDWTPDLEATGLIEGKDYFSYKDDKELLYKMNQLIIHDDVRNEVAERGRQKGLLNHTYEHRLISILNVIRSHGIKI